MNKYQENFSAIKNEVMSLYENHLEHFFSLIISYYNNLESTRPILLAEDQSEWEYTDKDVNVYKNLYLPFFDDVKNSLEDMLEEVYSTVSSMIKEIYGEDIDYPVSKIIFFEADGLTIDDRIEKWWNPYNGNSLNINFIKNKISAEHKINQIARSESLNEMEVIKRDKLFHNCRQIEIMNEDDEADCYENIHCEVYWGIYSVEDDDLPKFPLYHPDCECFTVYYP